MVTLDKSKLKGLKTGFEIFEPFRDCKGTILICTYGIAGRESMGEVVEWLKEARRVCLLVGYSKETHNSENLFNVLSDYKSLGWDVRMLPSLHLKIWWIDSDLWIGSANFCRSTIVNHMWRVDGECHDEVQGVLHHYWEQAHQLSYSTKLELLPQAKDRLF